LQYGRKFKRLNKFIGETGYCSRREADKMSKDELPSMASFLNLVQSFPHDEVRIDGKLIHDRKEKPVYLAFNKPVGIECTTNLEVRYNIVDIIQHVYSLLVVLDKASEGLIFMTNDGDIVNKILRPQQSRKRIYSYSKQTYY
jgi:23S rRNA pseudouridine2604 synthase